MTSPYQLVVFDWEGTISDALGQILHIVAEEAKTHGYGAIDFDLARRSVDLGLVQALKKLLPNLSDDEQMHLLQAIQTDLATFSSQLYLMPGVMALIEALHKANIHLAIATNKGQLSLQKVLQASGLDQFFKVVRCAGQVPPKPCPQMLEEIMEEFGVSAEQTVMIGDSASDMEMAHSLKVTAIGVDFYHHQEATLKAAGATVVFDDYRLVATFLKCPGDWS